MSHRHHQSVAKVIQEIWAWKYFKHKIFIKETIMKYNIKYFAHV